MAVVQVPCDQWSPVLGTCAANINALGGFNLISCIGQGMVIGVVVTNGNLRILAPITL